MIAFLHPWLLAGLTAAGVPLLLHLISRREPPTVVFPAVRYLVDTTREHQRRLRLQNWLLLLLRTLLIITLVLAAAGPSAPIRQAGGHGPTALVLVVDNSLSSGAVAAGTTVLTDLRAAGRRVLERATPEDALWLITADGAPRRGESATLTRLLDSLTPSARRMDLGATLTLANEVLASAPGPGEIVLVSDLQATATSPGEVRAPLLVARPDGDPVPNAGVGSIDPGPEPWTTDGGRVLVTVAGSIGRPTPVSVRLGNRAGRQALASTGTPVEFVLPGTSAGWWPLEAEVDPDELRADDARITALRVAPVARVNWPATDRYLAAACEVLAADGRIQKGDEVLLGRLGPGASVVEPPEDAAQLGALNRALSRRGILWTYGSPVLASAATDSGALLGRERVMKRYTLTPTGSGRTGVVATVGGAPWIVRSGSVVLLGSRLDPQWTALPISALFVPFVDALVNRLARGEVSVIEGAPGDPILLPDLITQVRRDQRSWPVEGGAAFRAPDVGVYYLMNGPDTAGALAVNPDPKESDLRRATDLEVRQLWPTSRIVGLGEAGVAAFSGAVRADLRGPFLWFGLFCAFAEVALASAWRRQK